MPIAWVDGRETALARNLAPAYPATLNQGEAGTQGGRMPANTYLGAGKQQSVALHSNLAQPTQQH